jgi:hypothetical protein
MIKIQVTRLQESDTHKRPPTSHQPTQEGTSTQAVDMRMETDYRTYEAPMMSTDALGSIARSAHDALQKSSSTSSLQGSTPPSRQATTDGCARERVASTTPPHALAALSRNASGLFRKPRSWMPNVYMLPSMYASDSEDDDEAGSS